MTSKKAPSSNQNPQPSLEQQLSQLRMQYAAVSEMLWETIREAGPASHEVEVSPNASDPLWELCFLRAAGPDGKPDPKGRIRICASTIPEMTESQKKRIIRFLRGTGHPLEDAMRECEIPHPLTYVESKIADRLKWNPGTSIWDSVTPATVGEQAKNILHFPK